MSEYKAQIDTINRYKWGYDIPLSTPFVIYIEPSGYCNLKCKFCPYALHFHELQKDIMTLGLFEKILSDIKQFPEQLKLIRFCGNGEPLLNKNLSTMLRLAKESNVSNKIQLITNGVLLHKSLSEQITQYAHMIVISIEGLSSDDYLNISNTKIDYKQLINNIKILYSFKKECIIHLKINNLVVSTEEKRQQFLNTFQDYCDEINIENIVPMFPDMQYYSNNTKTRFDIISQITNRLICPQIFKSMQILANGDVVPCCVDWKRKNLLGNIQNNSLLNIWNGDIIRTLRNKHLTGNKNSTALCQNCQANNYIEIDNIDYVLNKIVL